MESSLKSTYINTDVEPFYVGGTPATICSRGEILATPVLEEVIITNLATNEIIHRIEGDGETITNLVITPDASKLAILSQSQQLRIFDLNQGEIVKTFKLPSPVYISTVDSTSSLFAFGGTEGVITVWDIESGYVTHSLKSHNTTVCSLEFYGELNSANWKLASGDIMGTVKIWDLVKRKPMVSNVEHNSAVRGLGFDSEGEYFISGGRDEVVIVYKQENLKKPWKTYSVRHQVENCGFLDVDNQLVIYTAGSDNYVKFWDLQTGKLIGTSTQPLQTNEELVIIDVLKLEDDRLMLVISDQTLVELDLQEIDHSSSDLFNIPVQKRIAGNHGTIADLRYVGPNMDLIAMATNAPALRIIDPSRPLELSICEGHVDLLNALDVSLDGRWIATASKDNEAKLWQWQDDKFELYATFQGHAGGVTAVALPRTESDPKFIITASSDLTIKKWKVPTVAQTTVKTSEYTRRAHDKDINAIDIAPNNEYLATASYDKTAKIWDIESGETIGILKGHRRGLWDINFCKYDKLIITASGDKTIKLWSLKDYSCIKTFEGHTNAVQRAKFLNKNQQLISTGADGLIKIWSIKDEGECIKTFDNHANRIWAFDIKEDGEEFISADADGQISFWEDNSEEMSAELERQTKEKVEQEQKLSNFINNQDWSNAFLLALTLNHSMRLYNVIKSSIAANQDKESPIGSLQLESTIKSLSDDQTLQLLKKIRDWNVNFKFFEIAQKLLRVFVSEVNTEIPGVIKILESIIPYNERHFSRIDHLIEQSFILDYAVEEMSKIGA